MRLVLLLVLMLMLMLRPMLMLKTNIKKHLKTLKFQTVFRISSLLLTFF